MERPRGCRALLPTALVVVGALWLSGCAGESGSSDSGSEGVVADVLASDLPDPTDEADASSDRIGSETVEDAGPCADAQVDGGFGCFQPCADGWHPGEDGACHIDCPPFLSAATNGKCTVPVCPNGWRVDGGNCAMNCPEGFEAGGDFPSGCRLPCPDGFTRGEDGFCHRDCPEGMVKDESVVTGCRHEAIGPRMACPEGRWNIDLEAVNPLYVDAASEAATPDGSMDNPYRTIGEAIARAEAESWTSVSVFVGPGTYDEVVLFEGFETARLIGACSDRSLLAATGVGMDGDISLGAVSAFEVGNFELAGLTISSNRKGVLVTREADGGTAAIHDIVVDGTASHGVQVYGPVAEVEVGYCRIVHTAISGVAFVTDSEVMTPIDASLHVHDCEIAELEHCESLETCADYQFSIGISVGAVSDVVVERNLIRDFDRGIALMTVVAVNTDAVGNIVHGITGMNGISVDGDSVTVVDNRIAMMRAGEIDGKPNDSISGITIDAIGRDHMTGEVSGNYLEDILGVGLIAGSGSEGDRLDLDVVRNEFRQMPMAIMPTGRGDLTIQENRFSGVRVVLNATLPDKVLIEGNEVREGASGDLGMPAGKLRDYLIEKCLDQISVGMVQSPEEAEFRRNHVEGQPELDVEGGRNAVVFAMVPAVRVQGNLFENNRTSACVGATRYSTVNVSDNLFLGVDDGVDDEPGSRSFLSMGIEDSTKATTIEVRNNDVRDFMGGADSSLEGAQILVSHPEVDCTVESNRFDHVGVVSFYASGGVFADKFTYRNNDHRLTMAVFTPGQESVITGNRFDNFWLSMHDAPGTADMRMEGNLFLGGTIEVQKPAGTWRFANNEVTWSMGAGLLLLNPSGDVDVHHNLFDGVSLQLWPVGSVGEIGEAIQATGTAEAPGSGVSLTSNRILEPARWGIVVSRAAAFVADNHYEVSEAQCGAETCALAIQLEATPGTVTGADVRFAERQAETIGVVTYDDRLSR